MRMTFAHLTVFVALAATAASAQIPDGWTVLSADTTADGLWVTYHFQNGETYRPRIVRPHLVGGGESARETTFLLFRGEDCDDCDAGISLYAALRDTAGHWSLERFPYPGRGDGWVYYRSRAFFGACSAEPYDIIWRVMATGVGSFNADEAPNAVVDESLRYYVARVYERRVGALLIPTFARLANQIEEGVRAHRCWEIPPIEHLAEVGFREK